MTEKWLVNVSGDVMMLPSYAEKVQGLQHDELMNMYNYVTELKIYSWAFNCLLSYEAHRRGMSFESIATKFHCTRQTCDVEAKIWERILSKAPELLNEPFLSKTWYKRVIELNIPNPVDELWKIAKQREEISATNIVRKTQALPTVKQLSTRQYVRLVRHKNKIGRYICDKCGKSIDIYKKVCYTCFDKGV